MVNGKIKIAGIAFGVLAGYLLISKAMNVVRGCVKDICTASEWKAYYKDKEGLHVAPGYCRYTKRRKGAKEASEGETEASEKVVEYDENGKPVAGRYPFGNTDCDDTVVYPPKYDTAPGDPEVTYVDSLENGVDILEENEEMKEDEHE